METEKEFKKKEKRDVSIFTVFIWLALIVVMAVITITGINDKNALEGQREITVKIDWSMVDPGKYYSGCGLVPISIKIIQNNEEVTMNCINDVSKCESIYTGKVSSDDYQLKIISYPNEYCIYDEGWNGLPYYKYIEGSNLQSEFNFKVNTIITGDGLSNSVNWINDNKKAQVTFKYVASPLRDYGKVMNDYNNNVYIQTKTYINYLIFVEELSEYFSISDEYENNADWEILESVENEPDDEILYMEDSAYGYCTKEIPTEVIKAFFVNYNKRAYRHDETEGKLECTGKKFVYVRSTNTVYCLESAINTKGIMGFNVICNKDLSDINDEILVTTSKSSKVINVQSWMMCGFLKFYKEEYLFPEKQLKYNPSTNINIIVNKLVNNDIGTKMYYVGIFENEVDTNTKKIYKIETQDGVGSVEINLDEYDKTKNYYIYEVDELGNKIESYGTTYSKNQVLKDVNSMSQGVIESDNSIVSSTITLKRDEKGSIDIDNLVDNQLTVTNLYEDTVTITSEYTDRVHLVKYEAREGGTLDGVEKEVVKHGEKVTSVPIQTPNENYEIDKWIVIKDGQEIEVNPSEYVIEEDTTFIAIFKKIPARVIVKYVDEDGNEIAESKIIEGYVGDNYITEREEIAEYKSNEIEPENATGIMKKDDIEVVYVYKKAPVDTSDIDIWKYVGISAISIIGIIIAVISLNIRKKKSVK